MREVQLYLVHDSWLSAKKSPKLNLANIIRDCDCGKSNQVRKAANRYTSETKKSDWHEVQYV